MEQCLASYPHLFIQAARVCWAPFLCKHRGIVKGRRVLLLWKGRRDLIHMCACTRVSLKPRLSTREGKCSTCRQRAGDSEPNEDGQAVTGACGRVGKGELRSGGHQEGLRRECGLKRMQGKCSCLARFFYPASWFFRHLPGDQPYLFNTTICPAPKLPHALCLPDPIPPTPVLDTTVPASSPHSLASAIGLFFLILKQHNLLPSQGLCTHCWSVPSSSHYPDEKLYPGVFMWVLSVSDYKFREADAWCVLFTDTS